MTIPARARGGVLKLPCRGEEPSGHVVGPSPGITYFLRPVRLTCAGSRSTCIQGVLWTGRDMISVLGGRRGVTGHSRVWYPSRHHRVSELRSGRRRRSASQRGGRPITGMTLSTPGRRQRLLAARASRISGEGYPSLGG